jgi:hypothetical protein
MLETQLMISTKNIACSDVIMQFQRVVRDTESENYSVVIRKIGSHSMKSIVSKHGSVMGI